MDEFSHSSFCFSDFVVDPQANTLSKKQSEKRLEPKVISLLILLAGSHNKVITKQQIRDTIWPNVIVSDETIARTIFSLRKSLGDDAKRPRFIETIPKKGYRFIVQASLINDEISQSNDGQLKTGCDLNKEQKKWLTQPLSKIFLGLVSLLMLTVLITWLWKNNQNNFSSIAKIITITHAEGSEYGFAINLHNNEMVYVHDDGDKSDLYVRSLSAKEQVRRITQDDWWVYSPRWLDENTLIYLRELNGKNQIVRQHKEQEAEVLYQTDNGLYRLILNLTTANIVTFNEYDSKNEQPVNIKTLNLITGEINSLMADYPHLAKAEGQLLYSADGQILYFTYEEELKYYIAAFNFQSNELRTISEPYRRVESIALAESGELLVAGSTKQVQGLWSLDISEQKSRLLLPASSGQEIISAAVGAQGEIYYAIYESTTNLTLLDTVDNSLNVLDKVNTSGIEDHAIFSRDGEFIYYSSNRTGYSELWSYQLSSGKIQQVSQLEASYVKRAIKSTSGDYFAVSYYKEGFYLAVIKAATGEVVISKPIINYKFPLAWSPDDKFIYVIEYDKQVNLYQYNSETLADILVQEFAGIFTQPSSDGQSIRYVDYKKNALVEKQLTSGATEIISMIDGNLNHLRPGKFQVTSQGLIFVQHYDGRSELMRQPLIISAKQPMTDKENSHIVSTNKLNIMTEKASKLIELPRFIRVQDISKDGTKILFSKEVKQQGGIMRMQLNDY